MKLLLILVAFVAYCQAGVVQQSLLQKVRNGASVNAILSLPPVHPSTPFGNRLQRRSQVVASLRQQTMTSQAPFLEDLHDLKVDYLPFWLTNTILLRNVSQRALEVLSSLPREFEIYEEQTVHISPFQEAQETLNAPLRQGVQWNIAQIRAPEAWNVTQGEGSIVGMIDTGANIAHEALKDGWSQDGWADFVTGWTTPQDNNGHGSHVLGVAVGKTNGIGVAPGAKWIACRALDDMGSGSQSALTSCGQFLMEADPLPNVIINAWGGGGGSPWYNQILAGWRAVGIFPAFAVGGSGPSCGSVGGPGDQKDAVAIGASNQLDVVSSSSRGPSAEGLIKPELVAPGVNIISAGTGQNNYVAYSGSSFGCSHVAGVAALVLSQNPDLGAEEVLDILKGSAFQPPLTGEEVTCGPGPEDYPNNMYGWGRVDAAASVSK